MSKLLLEQRFIFNFILAVFNAVVGSRNRALEATMRKDPEFKAIVADLERAKKRLHDWVEKRAAKDPEVRKDLDAIRSLMQR